MREEGQVAVALLMMEMFYGQDEGLHDSGCHKIYIFNCSKNLETRVTKIFHLANTTNENQFNGTKQLNDVTDAVDFIRKKFEEYEEER